MCMTFKLTVVELARLIVNALIFCALYKAGIILSTSKSAKKALYNIITSH